MVVPGAVPDAISQTLTVTDSVSVSGGGSTRVNVAAASQGGTAAASSSYDPATFSVSP